MSALILRWRVPTQPSSLFPVAMIIGPPGRGVRPGGSQGAVLGKPSADDYDTSWIALATGDIDGLDNALESLSLAMSAKADLSGATFTGSITAAQLNLTAD